VPYVDLPLQHIADGVLARMRRGVTRRATEGLIGRLRERIAGLTLRTTFIVGFPGETEAEFQELLDFVRDFRFDAVGVFEFSPEPGTSAAEMPDQVPAEAVARRAEELMGAQREIVLSANAARVGGEIEVLVDGVDEEGCCFGRHAGQAPDVDSVCYLTCPRAAGTFVQGRVADQDEYDLIVAVADAGEAAPTA
jgi:ribosomal protein S12 methylthiotransferase